MQRTKCECGENLYETNIKNHSSYRHVVFLQKLYYCENTTYPHQINVCRFPDCDELILCNKSYTDARNMIYHIIKTHHKLTVVEGNGGNMYVNGGYYMRKHDSWINMSNILRALPHFLGLICEKSWYKIVNETCEYDGVSDSICNDDVVSVLYTLNYSCALCGEEYDSLPSAEVYADHIEKCQTLQNKN